jgi:cellulose synthase/poly-beta-1,6-N-acetylglucosamine synthase-like glycosyltransferase/peptidoglycan/xylan/chitin deacetylase (PgdA/CDA1 family)/spore germination protein YaaH
MAMIFEDSSRRRWRLAVVVFVLTVLAGTAVVGLAIAGLLVPTQSMPNVLPRRRSIDTPLATPFEREAAPVVTPEEEGRLRAIRLEERRRRNKLVRTTLGESQPLALPEGSVVAFLAHDDPAAVASLTRHIEKVDVVVPDWFDVPGPGCDVVSHIDRETRALLERSNVLVMPRLVNLSNGVWRGTQVAEMLANDDTRRCVVAEITRRLVELRVDGVNIDLEELAPEDSEPFLEFLVELRAALRPRNMRLTVDVAVHDPVYDMEYIGNVADAVMIMAYDEHYPSSEPGPVASETWFREAIDEVKSRVPAERLVVVLGSYGYDWATSEPRTPGTSHSFIGTMELARSAEALPVFAAIAENSHFRYTDENGTPHDAWFQDALATWNQQRYLKEVGISRVGLWRMGTEDETLWTFFGNQSIDVPPAALEELAPSTRIALFGDGEAITLRSKPRPGKRTITPHPRTGRIQFASYASVPSGWIIERQGGRNPKQVVLTFDDGPDPVYTPPLLDALDRLGAPGLFLMLGDQAMKYPQLVAEVAQRGHLVGNHSYSHPHFDEISNEQVLVELSSTQRLLEGLTGTRSPFFRPPYSVNVDIDRMADLVPIRAGLENGFVFVGANVDSLDWMNLTSEQMAERVVDGVTSGAGQIVLLHDGGGDRTKTIRAVEILVPELKRRGYEFVSMDRYLGIERQGLVERPPLREQAYAWGGAIIARVRSVGWTILSVLFFVCTMLSVVRILMLGGLMLKDARKPPPKEDPDFKPLTTVLVPAFNEEAVIERTLRSLLASEYEHIEIMVIDDGSTDKTFEVASRVAEEDSRIRVIKQANGGKAAASNHGLREAKGELIVAVDADTIIPSDAIRMLMRHFVDPKVTAVCGNVEVGNVNGFLTAFQAIEYVTSQNFDRRGFSALNCVSVVPGALGAWRRSAMLAVGGYSHDTLTEDADLTLTVLRNGGHITYEAEARARTEAPESLSALLKQRFRWTYGTYQCLWKHRKALFTGPLGWVGLPNMIMFQIVFPLMSPIGDIVMLLSILRGDWKAFLAGYVAFLLMDVCGSVLAFTLDKKPMRWLSLLLIQRFSYRQLMYYVALRSMIAALRGARHGWKKLARTGTVDVAAG